MPRNVACRDSVPSIRIDEQTASALVEALEEGEDHEALRLLAQCTPIQIAEFLITNGYEVHRQLLLCLQDSFDAEILTYLDSVTLNSIIEILGVKMGVQYIAKLSDEEVLDILRHVNAELRLGVIRYLPTRLRELTNEFLSYPEDSAGRLVSKTVVTVQTGWTVGQIIDLLRSYHHVPEDIYHIYVVDEGLCLVGYISLSLLIQSLRSEVVDSIMVRDVKAIHVETDQEEVAFLFRKHSLLYAPVVNHKHEVVGVISTKDIIDVIRTEATEDIMRLTGMSSETANINIRAEKSILNRLPWLVANIALSMLISSLVALFSETINALVVLAVLVPIITSIGGCCGAQITSSTIRALSFHEITSSNIFGLFKKEFFVSFVLGSILAVSSGAYILFRYQDLGLFAVYTITVIGVFCVSSLTGLCIPIVIHRLKMDPAIASPVIVSACSDAFTYLFFLGLATLTLLS